MLPSEWLVCIQVLNQVLLAILLVCIVRVSWNGEGELIQFLLQRIQRLRGRGAAVGGRSNCGDGYAEGCHAFSGRIGSASAGLVGIQCCNEGGECEEEIGAPVAGAAGGTGEAPSREQEAQRPEDGNEEARAGHNGPEQGKEDLEQRTQQEWKQSKEGREPQQESEQAALEQRKGSTQACRNLQQRDEEGQAPEQGKEVLEQRTQQEWKQSDEGREPQQESEQAALEQRKGSTQACRSLQQWDTEGHVPEQGKEAFGQRKQQQGKQSKEDAKSEQMLLEQRTQQQGKQKMQDNNSEQELEQARKQTKSLEKWSSSNGLSGSCTLLPDEEWQVEGVHMVRARTLLDPSGVDICAPDAKSRTSQGTGAQATMEKVIEFEIASMAGDSVAPEDEVYNKDWAHVEGSRGQGESIMAPMIISLPNVPKHSPKKNRAARRKSSRTLKAWSRMLSVLLSPDGKLDAEDTEERTVNEQYEGQSMEMEDLRGKQLVLSGKGNENEEDSSEQLEALFAEQANENDEDSSAKLEALFAEQAKLIEKIAQFDVSLAESLRMSLEEQAHRATL